MGSRQESLTVIMRRLVAEVEDASRSYGNADLSTSAIFRGQHSVFHRLSRCACGLRKRVG